MNDEILKQNFERFWNIMKLGMMNGMFGIE